MKSRLLVNQTIDEIKTSIFKYCQNDNEIVLLHCGNTFVLKVLVPPSCDSPTIRVHLSKAGSSTRIDVADDLHLLGTMPGVFIFGFLGVVVVAISLRTLIQIITGSNFLIESKILAVALLLLLGSFVLSRIKRALQKGNTDRRKLELFAKDLLDELKNKNIR